MSNYPAQIDNNQSLPKSINNFTPINSANFEPLRLAVLAIESTLGINPNSIYGTVSERLITLENILGNLNIIELTQDLGGTLSNPLVIGIQGKPVSNVNPIAGQSLIWNGIAWIPTTVNGVGTFSGDLSGTIFTQTVIGLQNHPVSNNTPIDGYVLTWNQLSNSWKPEPIGANLGTGVVHSNGTGNLISSTIVNADISATAAIAVSKLSVGTAAQVLLNNATPTPTWTTLSGDVTVSATGTTTVNSISGNSPINILASETILASGTNYSIIGIVNGITTINNTVTTAITYLHPDNTMIDWSVTFIGRNNTNNGDLYRSDFFFTTQRFASGAPVMYPGSPSASNIRSNGGGSSYSATVSISSNNILLNVVGVSSTTINWSVSAQATLRS
jgi:hypothetical protein